MDGRPVLNKGTTAGEAVLWTNVALGDGFMHHGQLPPQQVSGWFLRVQGVRCFPRGYTCGRDNFALGDCFTHHAVSCRRNKREAGFLECSFWWAGVLDKGTPLSDAIALSAITSHTMVSCRHNKRVVDFLESSFLCTVCRVISKGAPVSETTSLPATTLDTMVSCRHNKRAVDFLEYSFS